MFSLEILDLYRGFPTMSRWSIFFTDSLAAHSKPLYLDSLFTFIRNKDLCTICRYLQHYGVTFLQAWGMTETNPIATVARPIQKAKDLRKTDDERFENIVKAGLSMPGLELKIVDSEDLSVEMPQDGVAQGELLARGPTITGDYFKLPEEDRAGRFHDGWLVTGDIASIDPDGYLIIRDRSKDLIKSGGEWISSVDLENALSALPGVQMACVVAMPHPRWDERPVAILQMVPGQEDKAPTKEQVDDYLLNTPDSRGLKFAKFQLPDEIIVWESIPMTSTGKMSKKEARDRLQSQGYELPSLRASL